MKDVFKFDTDFKTKEPQPLHFARMVLASGNVVRFMFTPDGIKMLLNKSSLENDDVFVWDDEPTVFGIMPERLKK